MRWLRAAGIAAAAILLGEYQLLASMVDTGPLQRRVAWLSGLEYLAPLAIAIGTAILVFSITRKANLSPPAAGQSATIRRVPPYLAAHAFLFFTFLLLTRALFGSRALLLDAPEAWFVTWVLLGLATVAALALAVMSPRQLLLMVRQARVSILIGFLVGMAAWKAGRAAEGLWGPLGSLTVRAVAQVLSRLFSDSVSDPDRLLVGTSRFRVVVAPVCSGFEGIGLMIVLVGAWLVAFRRQLRFPNALLLLPLGVAVAWAGNVVRIVSLIAIASRWSPAIALGGFHSKAGWVLFCGAALALMVVTRRVSFFTREPCRAEKDANTWNPTAAYLAPLLFGIAVQLVAGAFSIRGDFLYPVQGLAILAALWPYRQSYGHWRFSFSWAVLAIGAGAFAFHLALERLLPHLTSSSGTSLALAVPSTATAAFLAGLAPSIIIVPLAEELAFRGFLLRRLISADFTEVSPAKFTWKSFLVSSLAFGALQSSWIAGTIAGMLYAHAQYRRGRIEDAILAHAVSGLLAAAYAFWVAPLPHS